VRCNTPFLDVFVSQKVHRLPSVSVEVSLKERQVNTERGSPGTARSGAGRPRGDWDLAGLPASAPCVGHEGVPSS